MARIDDIQVGDVVIDLAQGSPMHVLERYEGDVADWSREKNYELTENYGNARLGATDDDAVFECVYCESIDSKPARTYAFPESRLARVETEAADGGPPAAERAERALLEDLFDAALRRGTDSTVATLETLASDATSEAVASEARELAEAARFGADTG